jgi:hypothetical protein
MRFRYQGADVQSARHSIFDGPPPQMVVEGEVVGVYYDPDTEGPQLLLWDDKAGCIRTCPALESKKIYP